MAAAYHAGLKDSEREETQRKWTDGTVRIAVATVAFGMGIDLPHVRYVIHWTMAKSLGMFSKQPALPYLLTMLPNSRHLRKFFCLFSSNRQEGFYQESGRGGRDGKPTVSILYYSKDDATKFAFLVKKNAGEIVLQ